ncbi:MAG: adenylate/guanylate cyclase domain-containing protein [Pseudomonadota bacterium]
MLKRFIYIIILCLFALIIALGLSKIKAFESFEQWTFDLRQIAFAPATEISEDIVMVWLDENTMQTLPYRSPVPRDFLAQLNNHLIEAKPKLIAYDIFLKDPSFAQADQMLAASLKQWPTYAVVPMRIGGCGSPPPNIPLEGANSAPPLRGGDKGEGDQNNCVDLPFPLFHNSLKGIGLADLPFNAFDSVVRQTQFEFKTDLGQTPTLAALLYEKVSGQTASQLIQEKKLWPGFGPFSLTPFLADSNKTYIRFAGPPSTMGGSENKFKVFPAILAAKGLIPKAWLKDKIVLVGAAYADLEDAFLTPYFAKFTYFARMNGVEIHANILSSLLTKQFYFTLTLCQLWLSIALLIFIITTFTTTLPLLKSGLIFLGLVFGWLFLAMFSFKSSGIILPVVLPLAAALVSYGLAIAWRALTEGRQRRWLKGVFAQYVPPTVVEQMTKNPSLVRLGGDKRQVTSLFSDIASFTSISEKMDPPTLVKFLNEYLSLMNEILFRYEGTIDKYEGDAIIAFFNAPLEVANHELKAVNTALEIQAASLEITKKWQQTLGFPIITRIGLNTGPAVVGNMGSQDRFDYTAIGDTINLASRLEGTNKFYGTKIMASEMTVAKLDHSIISRPIDRVRVKGKSQPILLHEIMGKKISEDADQLLKLSLAFTQAFIKFEERQFAESKKILAELQTKHKDDGPTKELLGRITKAEQDPAWNLVTNLEAK